MRIRPLFTGDLNTSIGAFGEELSELGIEQFLSRAQEVQRRLSELNVEERLQVFEEMGDLWKEKLRNEEFTTLKEGLSKSTGYCDQLIEYEMNLVSLIFNYKSLRRALEASFEEVEALHKFVEIEKGEYKRYLPSGPVFIISSGNSLIPPLISTTLSLLTGNLTLLRPSISNYIGVFEVYSIMKDLNSRAAKLMSDGLAISYFAHSSPALKYLLTKAKIGVINFWGGDPARSEVVKLASENPHHPRLIVNGPLTGFVIIDEASVSEEVAENLARNVILYDQQLCSSPTSSVFVGSFEKAKDFAELLMKYLNYYGKTFKMRMNEGQIYLLQSARRALKIKGAMVYYSNDTENMWTIILSKDGAILDDVVSMIPEFNFYFRKRFLEMIVVDNWQRAIQLIADLPFRTAFKGVDKVQTVGLMVSDRIRDGLLEGLINCGVYRIVPIHDMHMRSPLEPYDGLNIPSSFTYIVYMRDRELNY